MPALAEESALAGGGGRWLQHDVALAPGPDSAWETIVHWWSAIVVSGRVRPPAWFVRKPPGLRLRVRVDDAEHGERIVRAIDPANAPGGVWTPGLYEPEQHRFGGPLTLAIAHDQLAISTASWIAWESQRRADDAVLAAEVMAVLLYDDVLARVTGDKGERWDVWCQLASLYYGMAAVPGSGRRTGLDLAAIAARGTAAERHILADAKAGNAGCVERLVRAVRSGASRIGPRAFAVTLATMHWNIWSIDRETLRRIVELMIAELDPVPAWSGR